MMISIEEVSIIHDELIDKFGGGRGIRDLGALEAALNRPYQTFGGEELYPTCFEKAAALGESIIMNHPFIDGNKRTGYLLMEIELRLAGWKIGLPDEEVYDFVIDITTGKLRYEDIVQWLQTHVVEK
jgi:death on curing protein